MTEGREEEAKLQADNICAPVWWISIFVFLNPGLGYKCDNKNHWEFKTHFPPGKENCPFYVGRARAARSSIVSGVALRSPDSSRGESFS